MLLFVCSRMDAAFEHLMKGSNVIATGGASTAILNNPWAAFCSPGALSSIPGRVASFYYSPQPFGLKELSHGSFSYVEPTALGAFALSGSRFGFELYREVDVQLSFGRGVNDMFSVGGSVHYCHLSIERYGSAHTFAVDVGSLARFTDRVQWGFTAFNVNGASIGAARERLPQVFVTGIAYLPVPEAMLVADLEKDIRYAVQLHAGRAVFSSRCDCTPGRHDDRSFHPQRRTRYPLFAAAARLRVYEPRGSWPNTPGVPVAPSREFLK